MIQESHSWAYIWRKTLFERIHVGQSQDGRLEGRGICISAQLGHLPGTGGAPWTPKGMGGTPSNRVGRGKWWVVRGEEKWRWDGTGTPEGPLREVKGSRAQRGKLEDHWGAEDQKGARPGFPCPLGSLGLILCPPRPPPAVRVLREWEGGKAEQK